MRHCEQCGVDVAGSRTHCPLCQGPLSPCMGDSRETFPRIPTIYRQYHFLFRVMIFASIAAGVAAVAVNLMLPETGFWSAFVVGGIACLWLSLALAVRKRKNIPKGMLYQVALISVICVVWDWATHWSGWSIDYVVPILCVSVMAALAVLSRVFHWETETLIVYVCIDALFGVVPLIFFLTGCLNVPYPSIICVAASVISLAALVVFKGDSIWAELRRRLHF